MFSSEQFAPLSGAERELKFARLKSSWWQRLTLEFPGFGLFSGLGELVFHASRVEKADAVLFEDQADDILRLFEDFLIEILASDSTVYGDVGDICTDFLCEARVYTER